MRFRFPRQPGDESRRPLPPSDSFSPGSSCGLPPTEKPAPQPPADSADLIAAVRRLTEVCAEHLAAAPRLGLRPSRDHLLRAADAALAEATSGQPPDWPGDDIEGYFLHALYDELVQQPANLFAGTRLLHGEEIPVPVSADTWIECLRVFRAAILRGDIVVPSSKPTARYLGPRRPGHVFVPLSDCGGPAPESARLAAIKNWTRDILALASDDVVTVGEFTCRDPGCNALETIVAVFTANSSRRWKLPRSASSVTPALLRQTLRLAT